MGATKQWVETRLGRIAYLEAGPRTAPAVLLIHGIPTSGYLWRHVMAVLGDRYRCLAPDLMGLGDTIVDIEGTDFSMPSQAEMLEEFLDALAIPRAHVVAHDQGGAAAQILAATRPQRIDRLVLTDCVCYDNWPVAIIRRLQRVSRLPMVSEVLARTGAGEWLETHTRFSGFRHGVVDPESITPDTISEYLRPLHTPEGRARFRGFLQAGSARYTLNVLPLLREYRAPTLILWAAEDAYLPPSWGQNLYYDIPGAVRFEVIPGAGHFWPEEKPGPFAAHIAAFLAEPIADREPVAADVATAMIAADRLAKKCPAPRRRAKS